VASSHFDFTTPDPTGVVGVVAPDEPGLLALVTLVGRAILAGNTVVAIASETAPLPALSLAETLATSDLPGGVVNLLTGKRAELAPWLASHMDVNAIVDGSGDPEIRTTLRGGSADNLKRVHDHSLAKPGLWTEPEAEDPAPRASTLPGAAPSGPEPKGSSRSMTEAARRYFRNAAARMGEPMTYQERWRFEMNLENYGFELSSPAQKGEGVLSYTPLHGDPGEVFFGGAANLSNYTRKRDR